ncbi:ATP-binding protein [Allonocardiopsis opalescens]|uniref:ATP-binding protein n=1 Tax=Allonocardiopsis opalescens TaxID=1144618 RepID=UPI000D069D13|nr:ATP-binding protein [Allonocardiopsis opalescens]
MDKSISLPATDVMVGTARRFAAGILVGTPVVADAELIASELATNALRSVPAGGDAEFTVRVRLSTGLARIEVRDEGPDLWRPGADQVSGDDGERYGLAMVSLLASRFGARRDRAEHVVWAELSWQPR